MNYRFVVFVGAALQLLFLNARAQDLEKAGAALTLIAQFADSMCTTVPIAGASSSLELSGQAKAEVEGLLRKLTDIGIDGAAKYKTTEYQGLLQTDLKDALKNSSTCKQKIFDDLKDRLLPKESPVASIHPKWGETHFYSGSPPRTHEQFLEHRKKITEVRATCAQCVVQTDKTHMSHPGQATGFTLGQLIPGSVLELDATRCIRAVRYQFTTQQMRVIQNAPPAIGTLFAVVDVQPGVRSIVELAGQHGYTAEPVQCL